MVLKKILIVDDSKTSRMMVRRCLEIAGITDAVITEAEHGRDALEQLQAAPVDLVLTDLNMPEMDGETLMRHVKASPKLTAIPIIVISSAAHEGNVEKLKSQGAVAVINKPMSPTAISDAVAALE